MSAYWGFTHGVQAGVSFMLECLFLTAVLAVMEVSLSFDNPVVETLALGNLALLAVNTVKILNTSKNIKRTSNSLNEAYDELNIPEEERVIDHEGRSK